MTLRWPVAQDDRAVAGYQIFREGRFLTTTTKNLFVDRARLSKLLYYRYEIRAFDEDGNQSSSLAAVLAPAPKR